MTLRLVATRIIGLSLLLIGACSTNSPQPFVLTGGAPSQPFSGGDIATTGGTLGTGGLVLGSGGDLPTTGGTMAVVTGGTDASVTGMDASMGDAAINGTGGASSSPLPTPTDYGATGPFSDAKMFTNVGPSSNYTLFRPDDASLGRDGIKHPIVAWGNGISTNPTQYESLLTTIASHGFVIIATNDTTVERPAMSAGLDWLVEQNDTAGPMQGKLDVTKEATIGYSWGGGAAIDTADRPNVLATVSFHGMPPRGDQAAFDAMHAPLLLFTSTGDTFVSRSGFVQPNYDASIVQTALAEHEGYSHTTPLLTPGDAGDERAPAIAWLYLWVYGEHDAEKFFYGADCILCMAPWTDFDTKNWQ